MFQNYSRTTFNLLLFKFALIFVGPQQTYFELGQALISHVYLSMLPITNHFACFDQNDIAPEVKPKNKPGVIWDYAS